MKKALVFLMLFSTGGLMQAQFKTIVLEEATSTGLNGAINPSVAINPKDPDNIIAVAGANHVYVTTDGGETWKTTQIKSEFGQGNQPVIKVDSKGNFYCLNFSDPAKTDGKPAIVSFKSTDDGESWTQGDLVSEKDGDQGMFRATIDPKSNDIVTTWTQFTKGDCESNVFISASGNGSKWDDPVRLNRDSGDCDGKDKTVAGSIPAVGSNGERFVLWGYNQNFYLDRSMDKGGIWLSNDLVIGNQTGGMLYDIPGLQQGYGLPVLLSDNSQTQLRGALYLLWSDLRSGETNSDIWFSRSYNYGDIWTPPLKVFDDSTASYQFHGAMTQDQTTGFIYVVYYDRSLHENNATDVYLAYSVDGGTTFTNNKISETPFIPTEDATLGAYIDVSAHEGRIVPVWTRMEEGQTSIATTIIDQDVLIPQLAEKEDGKKKKKKK